MIDCTAPSQLVEEYERYQPPGDPGAASVLAEATAAVAAYCASTKLKIFDDALPPRSADVTAQFAYLCGQPPAVRFPDEMADYHRRALATGNEALAEMFRSRECLVEVATSAGRCIPSRPAEEACASFCHAVAEQLAATPSHPRATAASDMLAAKLLANRLLAAEEMHRQAAAAAAARAEAERRAAQEAADAVADADAAVGELERVLQSHGIPLTLRTGEFVELQLKRCTLLATAKRRLNNSPAEAIRINIGQGGGLYDCKGLARGIGESSVDDLRRILRQLDIAEGKEQTS